MQKDQAPVSGLAPFLSNLNVLDNISLICDNMHHFTHKSSESAVLEKLELLELGEFARTHHTTLNEKVYFLVQLVRATMREEQNIVIDSPFLMVPTQKDLSFIIEALNVLNLDYQRVLIVDIISQAHKYKEEFCHIEEC